MIGAELGGKYRIDKKIGEGGFGCVYRGFDLNLKRAVAVKVLTAVGSGGSFRARFQRESESLAQLTHSNIVTLFDCGDHEERPYQVMELVEGVSLLDLLRRATLTPAEICNLCLQVCEAMIYAHGKGIIHRDLTLKNIMVELDESERTRVKIVDFGLAKLLHAEAPTTGKGMMGTPSYIAPEQIRGGPVDHRADIFSFGVCLFRMLNGRYPFESEHPTAVMYLILNETNIQFEDEVPPEFQEIVRRCLEKDPRNRPRSFAELKTDFEAIRGDPKETDEEPVTVICDLDSFANRSSKRNPYLNRVMIKNPSDFFGREKEVRKIFSRLDAPHPQSISVVGERRIGKSSLLNHVYHRSNRKRFMQNYENAIFVYLDFQSNADFDVPKFIDFLFTVFGYETEIGRKYGSGDRTLERLKEAVKELHDGGRRIIVLMDEFEKITRNKKFDEGFFSFLRALANGYRVAYLTSSCDELQLMCHNKDISDSPFFNIFSNLPLRPFTEEAALALIRVPSETEGVPLEPFAPKILALAGLFPLYLQIACSCVFENLLNPPAGEPDWPRIVATFDDEVSPHFDFLWERMEEPERDNLYKVATGKNISRKYEFVNENLVRRGYLRESEGRLALFSDAFKCFVLRQQEIQARKRSFLGGLFGRKSR